MKTHILRDTILSTEARNKHVGKHRHITLWGVKVVYSEYLLTKLRFSMNLSMLN